MVAEGAYSRFVVEPIRRGKIERAAAYSPAAVSFAM
jgi:hypothetical protein